MAPRLTKYIPRKPTPKQAAFLLLPHLEAFYGGAAGGGKSAALLMAALQYADIPGYSALLLRRTFRDLNQAEALIPLSKEWLRETDAKWNDNDRRWTFPSGATLTFGYLEHEDDKFQYQGAAFQFVGFDELTHFSETQYRYLLSRVRRRIGLEVPLRARGASNPGGGGHEWVFRYFVVEGPAAGRPFIPARLDDNPHLDRVSYEAALDRLDPVTRAQLKLGDWNARQAGGLFQRSWFTKHIVDAVRAGVEARCRYWDLAGTDPEPGKDPDFAAGAKVSLLAGRWAIEDMRRKQGRPAVIEELIRSTAAEDGKEIPIFVEEEPGSGGKWTVDYLKRHVLVGYAVKGVRSTGKKITRWRPVASAAGSGNVEMVRGGWNTDLLDELEAVPLEGVHDDQADALGGAFGALSVPVGVGVTAMWI